MTVRSDAIPADLTAIPRWVVWRWERRNGKPTKPPYQPNGKPASSTDPATWSTYETAATAYHRGEWAGIGLVLCHDDDLVGIDLDHCRDPKTGEIQSWALEVVRAIGSYAEVSPSGTGLRIITRAKLPPHGRKRGDVEIYEAERYLTITGNRLEDAPATIERRQAEVTAFHARYFPEPAPQPPPAASSAAPLSDEDVLALARRAANGAKVDALYRGSHDGYASASEADLALVSALAFYTQDEAQLDRLFRGSGRMRDKWERADYRARTIGKALAGLTERYTPAPPATVVKEPERPPPPEHSPDERPSVSDVLARHRGALIDWQAFWAADRTEEEWLVEPILPRRRSVSTYAPAKAGKSLLSLDVAARVATGKRVLDQPSGAGLTVCYFDLEMTEGDVYERLEEMGYGPADDLSRLHYYLLPSLPPLDTHEGGAEVRGIVAAHDADLAIIDTTSRVLSGPENDADTLRAYWQHTGRLLKADGRTVWRLDHAGKDLERGQRGTSAKNDDVDIVWQLTQRDGGAVRLRATHRRLSWVPETVDLVRLEDPLRHERARGTWPAGTEELVKILDELGVPTEHGGNRVRRALRDAGHKVRNEVVAAAIRWRREELSVLGDRSGDRSEAPTGTGSGDRSAKPLNEASGQPRGQVGTGSAVDGDNLPVPYGDRLSPDRLAWASADVPEPCVDCGHPAYMRLDGRPRHKEGCAL